MGCRNMAFVTVPLWQLCNKMKIRPPSRKYGTPPQFVAQIRPGTHESTRKRWIKGNRAPGNEIIQVPRKAANTVRFPRIVI